jgi:hypothetical protein
MVQMQNNPVWNTALMVSRFQISDRDSPVDPLFEIVLTNSQIIFRLLACHEIRHHVTKTLQRRNGQISLLTGQL